MWLKILLLMMFAFQTLGVDHYSGYTWTGILGFLFLLHVIAEVRK